MTVDIQDFQPEGQGQVQQAPSVQPQEWSSQEILVGFYMSQVQLALTNLAAIERFPFQDPGVFRIKGHWKAIYRQALLGLTQVDI